MRWALHPSDLALLRAALEEAAREAAPEPKSHVSFPPLRGAIRDEEAVEVGDALTAALGAVAGATRRLHSDNVAIDLGSEPLGLELAGELVGTSTDAERIFIRVRPERKEASDAR